MVLNRPDFSAAAQQVLNAYSAIRAKSPGTPSFYALNQALDSIPGDMEPGIPRNTTHSAISTLVREATKNLCGLSAEGRTEKALAALRQIAALNNAPIPPLSAMSHTTSTLHPAG